MAVRHCPLVSTKELTNEKLKGLSISYSGILALGGLIGISVVAKMLAKKA